SESQEGTESAAGTIVATDPSAGATVDPASPITLYRATGRSSVPDVSSLGVSADAAIKLLSQAGFHNVTTSTVDQDGCRAGIICGQTPPAGTPYLRSAPVNIQVGRAVSPSPSPSPTPSPSRSS
ncbi:PASTA domain-containing protein, partial [Propionibacterium freudenreichii]|nr:PASTA domain-containing protein [Propionibacterium freudenreichii]